LVKNSNFGQKFKFWSTIKILGKNRNFSHKSLFWTKIGQYAKFSQKSTYSTPHYTILNSAFAYFRRLCLGRGGLTTRRFRPKFLSGLNLEISNEPRGLRRVPDEPARRI